MSAYPNRTRPLVIPDPASQRCNYTAGGLSESDLAESWTVQFARWFAEASAMAGEPGPPLTEPNAVVLATADERGRPSARTVLLKAFDERGFSFFTNYGSRKAREAAANPYGSLVFPWYALERQVVAIGRLERVPPAETEMYFHSRPRGSQLGAWASRQSEVIESREVLERRRAELEERWPEPQPIPVPPFWGGIRLVPQTVEFWQGRPDRLHDRLRYRWTGPDEGGAVGKATPIGTWVIERLSP